MRRAVARLFMSKLIALAVLPCATRRGPALPGAALRYPARPCTNGNLITNTLPAPTWLVTCNMPPMA